MQFVTSLWFNHVIFLHFDKECFSSETRDAGVLVVHVGGPSCGVHSWTVRNPWKNPWMLLCVFFFRYIYILYIYKWTKRQHKILEKWQGGTVLVGMDT